MAGEKIFKMWVDVADRSRLVISAQTKDSDTFVIARLDGVLVSPAGKIEGKIDEIINAATGDEESILLRTPRSYVVDVKLLFVTDATVTVRGRIEPADEDQEPFVTKLTRKKGDVEDVTFFVAMA